MVNDWSKEATFNVHLQTTITKLYVIVAHTTESLYVCTAAEHDLCKHGRHARARRT